MRGREYRVIPPSLRDPRLHVAAVLLTLQALGQTVLDFRLSVAQILVCLAAGALIEFGVGFFKDGLLMWPASGLLTGNSTAFILRTPGTLHGQWWSLQGIWIFVAPEAIWVIVHLVSHAFARPPGTSRSRSTAPSRSTVTNPGRKSARDRRMRCHKLLP